MQPAASIARASVARQAPNILFQAQKVNQDQPVLPDWLKDSRPVEEVEKSLDTSKQQKVQQLSPVNERQPVRVTGVSYKLFIGANLPLYSSSEQETKLRNMHEPNHKELRISKIAARVADFLWPRCQDDIDEALAKAKVMQASKRVHEEDESVYEPPEVPHVLPVTTWIRNSKELRESFICDENTRYKPRLAWYNPNDGMIPSGWFTEGLMADLAYYKPFTGLRESHQKW